MESSRGLLQSWMLDRIGTRVSALHLTWGGVSHQLVDDSLDGELEYLGQGQATDAHSRGKLLVQDLVEMGMRMYKRCREGDVEPRKKKEGVEGGEGEEEVVPVQFVGIDGQRTMARSDLPAASHWSSSSLHWGLKEFW